MIPGKIQNSAAVKFLCCMGGKCAEVGRNLAAAFKKRPVLGLTSILITLPVAGISGLAIYSAAHKETLGEAAVMLFCAAWAGSKISRLFCAMNDNGKRLRSKTGNGPNNVGPSSFELS